MNSPGSVLEAMPWEDVEVKEAFANRGADAGNWIFVSGSAGFSSLTYLARSQKRTTGRWER